MSESHYPRRFGRQSSSHVCSSHKVQVAWMESMDDAATFPKGDTFIVQTPSWVGLYVLWCEWVHRDMRGGHVWLKEIHKVFGLFIQIHGFPPLSVIYLVGEKIDGHRLYQYFTKDIFYFFYPVLCVIVKK